MNTKKIFLIPLLLILIFILSACGQKEEEISNNSPLAIPVKAQTAAQSLSIKQELSYPGTVVAESEAKISAKANGNIIALNYKVGDKVELGQELARIDDVNSNISSTGNFNNNQIKQAKLAVEQAAASYNLARSSYNNLLISSVKDLRQAEIARDQAAKGQSNLENTTTESLKSAELAYETAKIATEQAKLTLENRQKLASQNTVDTEENAQITINSVINLASTMITNVNNITAFDENSGISISYRSNLGALNTNTYNSAKQAYQNAKSDYSFFMQQTFSTTSEKVKAAMTLTDTIKQLVDKTKILLENTIVSSVLPQTSLTGVSLSSLQTTVVGYQTQVNAAVSQINSVNQALINVELNNVSLLDSLRQAYELAKQQEASAEQSLNNLKAGNSSQKDQAGFAYNLAQNQYDNLKIKLEAQIDVSKTQMETAELQYNNALVTLQSLYDAHSIISPLQGTITTIFVSDGETVSLGQPIVTVSQLDNIKVQFYIEPENWLEIRPGQPVTVRDDKGTDYLGIISALSPQADPTTRRFLAEVKLENSSGLFLGTIVTVNVNLIKTAGGAGYLILPLAAVNVGQSSNNIFIIENNRATKVPVEIIKVLGEYVKIKTDLPLESVIIIDGNKLIQDGELVSREE